MDTRLKLDVVWKKLKPILSPIVTPENMELQPLRGLNELCSYHHYEWDVATTKTRNVHVATVQIPVKESIILWAYATYKKLKFYQIDVKYAFLNGIPFILKMFNQWPIQPEIKNYIQPSIPIQNGGRSNPNLSTNMDTHTPTKYIPLNT